MQRLKDDSIWDLVICIAGGAGTFVWMFWAVLLFSSPLPFPLDRRLSALGCVIMASLMLSSAVNCWYQWKQRR